MTAPDWDEVERLKRENQRMKDILHDIFLICITGLVGIGALALLAWWKS